MKSNLNIKILKLCISEICIQVGFERISEQSLNILSDVLKHYISQISLKLNKAVGSNVCFENSSRFCINNFLISDSFREREISSFLKSQIALRKYLGDQGTGKSLLHSLKILPNDQIFTGITRNNSNEIDPEPNLKTSFVTETIDKDEEFKKFLKHCNPESFRKRRIAESEFDFSNILGEAPKKKFNFDQTYFSELGILENKPIEIYNDIADIFTDFPRISRQKVFKNYE
ncbi:hypothetical protein P3W45_001193 [Vairimorpha bombi]